MEYKYRKEIYLHHHLLTSDLGVPFGVFSQNFYAYKAENLGKSRERRYTPDEALKNAIILQIWIAIKVCTLAYQNKTEPQTTLEEMGYEQQDYQIAYVYVKTKINKKIIKVEKPTLYDFSTLIAQIGGSNLQKNRHLGVLSLWKGWNKFLIIRETWIIQKDVGNQ